MARALRVAVPADGAAVAAIYRPHVVDSVVSFELEPPDANTMGARIAATLPKFPYLVATDADGEVVGYAYANTHRERAAYNWTAEVSVYVAERVRRGGVARALYGALFALLRAQRLRQAYAVITLPNPPSVACHEALGFVALGRCPAVGWKAGRWCDVGYWGLDLAGGNDAPAQEIIPFSVLADGQECAAALEEGTRALQHRL
eukprot:TRINITY_DN10245_c0_g1_i2.p1 TRINITY_DN10245_c0_g1~~TRINITY_DN10245_c0_g1_i2.p1  ORF type:complete len:203 (-),score=43.91 TRINITY_DN10245_c0_g1_i2:4-612(-)